jgi:hypothetical protein
VTDVFTPEKIVDALAYLGLSAVPGIRAAFGCGTSGITFPGDTVIAPIPSGGRLEPFTWAVDMPLAPIIRDGSATVTDIDWMLTAHLYLDRNDIAEAQRQASPFYGRLLTAVHSNAQLGGTCNAARIVGFTVEGDEEKVWLRVTVSAWQRLNLETQSGPLWT